MKTRTNNPIKSFLTDKDKIKIVSIVVWSIFILSQFIITFWFSGNQISDAKRYTDLALSMAEQKGWYPNTAHLHNTYFFGNGYVNFLSLLFRITTNMKFVFVINILLTQILLGSCLFVFKKLSYSPIAHYYFLIMFCLLNTFISEIVLLRTEMIFTALCFFALAFLYTDKKYMYILCGIVLAIANWIRPLGIAFLFGGIVIHIYYKRKFKTIFMTILSYILTIILIGAFSYINCGHFVYQSTTFGINLLMSANDNADGSYMNITQRGEAGYIDPEKAKDMIFRDYDKHYTDLSIKWIIKNPSRYLSQTPAKLFYLYATETYSGSSYFNNNVATGGIDYIKSIVAKFNNSSDERIQFGDFLIIFNQIWYMFLFTLAFIGLFMKSVRKNIKPLYAYLLIMALGTGITLVVVGAARYHFPYLPVIIMYAAITLETLLNKKH